MDSGNISFRQMYFDSDGIVKPEIQCSSRELTQEEKQRYDKLAASANQMTIYDFLERD